MEATLCTHLLSGWPFKKAAKPAITNPMINVDHNLARFLEIENLLNAFFASFDFCMSHCIKPRLTVNDGQPVVACCQDKYYTLFDVEHEGFDRLRRERERLYGTPSDHFCTDAPSPCEYHDAQNGCILATHKSPACLAFFCRKAINHLRSRFDIYFYDYLGILYALEWILTGMFPDKDYLELKHSIISAINKIDSTRNNPVHSNKHITR